jgi:hypothetical protein
VVVSEAAHTAFGDASPVGVAFRDLGTHQLKGLPEPERLFQLLIAGARTDFPTLRVGAQSPPPPDLPGRSHELARSLQAALTRLRMRRHARTLEHDQVSPTQRLILPHVRLEEEIWGDPLARSRRGSREK